MNALHANPTWAFAAKVGGFWARLPVPPSLNNNYLNASRSARNAVESDRIRSPRYKRWAEEAGWMIRRDGSMTARRIEGRFVVAQLISSKESGDADNRFKAMGDLLVSHRITEDDSRNDAPMTLRFPFIPRGTCEVIAVPTAKLPDLLEFLASLARSAGAGAAGPSAAIVPPSAAGGFSPDPITTS